MPEDLSRITDQQAEQLCAQLRERLIEVVSQTGGHLALQSGRSGTHRSDPPGISY